LGIASYTAQTKVKEIGIRKIMGASAWGLMLFLSKGFLWMLFIATLIALPVSYYLNQLWLQEFAVRVNFVSWMVLAGVLAILGIGVLTIASQTYRAATSNPVEALRAE
jgi:putative ABC transport system permease protein